MQERHTALGASLVIGILWGLWHVPLFWVSFSSQHNLPMAEFVLHDVALAVLFTWIYNNTGGSLWMMLLLHTAINVTTFFLPIRIAATGDTRPLTLAVILLYALAALVVFVFGPERLSHATPYKTARPSGKALPAADARRADPGS